MISARLHLNHHDLQLRTAHRGDIPAIAALLADDVLGQHREATSTDLAPYTRAFELFESHPNQELIVVEHDDTIVGTFDLTVLASLSRRGAVRLQVEAVRVASSMRGSGLGSVIFEWLITYARQEGYDLIQLTSDRSRTEAQAFYERLGFTASHVGYKLDLRATEG